jgi:HD-like signal output (HDOD) protein
VHEEAAGALARSWKLSPDVALVMQNHHGFRIAGRVHPLAAVLCVADWAASAAGAGALDESRDAAAAEAARELSLPDATVRDLKDRAAEVVASLDAASAAATPSPKGAAARRG